MSDSKAPEMIWADQNSPRYYSYHESRTKTVEYRRADIVEQEIQRIENDLQKDIDLLENERNAYVNMLAERAAEIARLNDYIRVMVEKAAVQHRPAYDEQQQRIMRLADELAAERQLVASMRDELETLRENSSDAWAKLVRLDEALDSERQRARLPEELVERIFDQCEQYGVLKESLWAEHANDLLRDILAAVEQSGQNQQKRDGDG